MTNQQSTLISVLALFTIPFAVAPIATGAQANENTAASNQTIPDFFTKDSVSFSVSLFASQEYQKFESQDAGISTLVLTPQLHSGNWIFSADIPWQYIDGEQFVNSSVTSLSNACEQFAIALDGIDQAQNPILFELRQRQFTAACGTLNENPSQTITGLADISLMADYQQWIHQNSNHYYGFTTSIKFDNADTDEGLGSGTQEAYVQARLGTFRDALHISFSMGYIMFIGGENKAFYEDYLDANFSIGRSFNQRVYSGVSASWTQAASELGEDLKSLSGNISIDINRQWSLLFYLEHYIDVKAYIEESYTGAINYTF